MAKGKSSLVTGNTVTPTGHRKIVYQRIDTIKEEIRNAFNHRLPVEISEDFHWQPDPYVSTGFSDAPTDKRLTGMTITIKLGYTNK